jgi:hypothetical protein
VREHHRGKSSAKQITILGPEGVALADEVMDWLVRRSGLAAIVART